MKTCPKTNQPHRFFGFGHESRCLDCELLESAARSMLTPANWTDEDYAINARHPTRYLMVQRDAKDYQVMRWIARQSDDRNERIAMARFMVNSTNE